MRTLIASGRFTKRLLKDTSGVTLVELMLTISLSAILLIVLLTVHISQERIYVGEETYMNMYRNTTTALDNMTRTLRLAGYNPQGSSQFEPGFRYGGSDSIEVVIDYDADGLLSSNELVTYTLRNFSSSGIDSINFKYLNQGQDTLPLPVPADSLQAINSVVATVVMRRDKEVAGPVRYELSREIMMRN